MKDDNLNMITIHYIIYCESRNAYPPPPKKTPQTSQELNKISVIILGLWVIKGNPNTEALFLSIFQGQCVVIHKVAESFTGSLPVQKSFHTVFSGSLQNLKEKILADKMEIKVLLYRDGKALISYVTNILDMETELFQPKYKKVTFGCKN